MCFLVSKTKLSLELSNEEDKGLVPLTKDEIRLIPTN